MAKAIQNAIRIGDSVGITFPAKDAKRMGITPGTPVKLDYSVYTSVQPENVELVAITQKLIKRHQQALKNLSQR